MTPLATIFRHGDLILTVIGSAAEGYEVLIEHQGFESTVSVSVSTEVEDHTFEI